ncbi:hypothetical protein BZG36_04456 [Bifiguratus adelaidae]|uniref:trimethyllysine dioxygenase n=1 Tax=Bifiguratus adelaidae TaxID=1938954 RepID=A0A261XVE1_9FUNG|nr:hypothetical protein BZG36_04456 [Bifiguratus adelaidae]
MHRALLRQSRLRRPKFLTGLMKIGSISGVCGVPAACAVASRTYAPWHGGNKKGFSSSATRYADPNATSPVSSPPRVTDKIIIIPWQQSPASHYDHFWLRDHCRCPECYHQVTRQRLVNTFSIPETIKPSRVNAKPEGLEVIWEDDSHKSLYDWTWLHHHSYNPSLPQQEVTNLPATITWDAATIFEYPPAVQYKDVMDSDAGLVKWIENIEIFGFSFVEGVPVDLLKTEELARRISFIRETHYSKNMWDFTADLAHADTAYTDLALKAHTDTTYFTDPAGLQLFHLLEFEGKGGESLLVDGFHVAKQLKEKDPESYEALSTIPISAHSAGDPHVFVRPEPALFNILRHDPFTKELSQIRYNNDDRSTLSHLDQSHVHKFYKALRAWNSLLTAPENEYWVPLKPGKVVIFDNWRVLHGRAAFTGHRRLAGCYLGADDWRSRVRALRMGEDVKGLVV